LSGDKHYIRWHGCRAPRTLTRTLLNEEQPTDIIWPQLCSPSTGSRWGL